MKEEILNIDTNIISWDQSPKSLHIIIFYMLIDVYVYILFNSR